MTKTNPLLLAALSLFLFGFLFGCASAPGATSPETPADEAPVIDLDERPLVLDTGEELRAFIGEFSQVVEDATDLLEDLKEGAFEEEVDRIERLRGRLERWRGIAESASIDPDSTEISPEEYDRFTAELASLRNRLWDVVLEINREIAEATGMGPGVEQPDAEG
jgi:hypothetical protein